MKPLTMSTAIASLAVPAVATPCRPPAGAGEPSALALFLVRTGSALVAWGERSTARRTSGSPLAETLRLRHAEARADVLAAAHSGLLP